MIIPLLALAAMVDPYGGFQAKLNPFGRNSYAPWRAETLREGGYDVTSLLYKRRARLFELMGSAREPSEPELGQANLLVKLGGRTWVVYGDGTVQVDGKASRLTIEDFRSLRNLVRSSIPVLDPDRDPPR